MTWILVREHENVLLYFTGKRGHWRESMWKQDAFHFSSARGAYECAETHAWMKPDDWRAVRRVR
jgi:hypothetical protein